MSLVMAYFCQTQLRTETYAFPSPEYMFRDILGLCIQRNTPAHSHIKSEEKLKYGVVSSVSSNNWKLITVSYTSSSRQGNMCLTSLSIEDLPRIPAISQHYKISETIGEEGPLT
jgi:hypothetical protein